MKGIVFTEFLEMVEENYGYEVVDTIIENSTLQSKGIYTSVGTYDFKEMVSLITSLSKEINVEIQKLIYTFGLYFFHSLTRSYPKIFTHYKTAFGLLSGIENHIHVHVRKIYPDAELPYFIVHTEEEKKLVLEYQSERAMYHFALGLMEQTLKHFNEEANIEFQLLNKEGTKVMFTLTKDAK